MVRTALIFFAGVLFAVGEVEARQDKVPKQSATPKPVMSVGLLAITTDHQGVLFIDGERRGIVSPGEVVSMKVVAGQHFVDLRDANGSKLWDKVVTIPPNTQVVEKIEYVRELDERDEQSLTDRILPPGPNIRTEEVAKYCTEPDDLAAKLANAGACADVLYDRGENQKALAKANQAIQGTEQIDHDIRSLGQEPITNDSEQLGAMYLLRARIQYALSNESGALSDLRTSLDYLRGYRQFVQKLATLAETATPELREKAKVFQQFLASPDPYVIQVHITRALILYRMASYAEALNDYNEYRVMVSTTGRENVVAKRLGDLIKKRIADATSAGEVATPSAPQLPSDNQESDIRREIDSIARSGKYSPLPEPQMSLGSRSGKSTATRILRNDTSYSLHILLSGPVDRKIDLGPRGSTSIELPPGSYRVAARVDAVSVLPFYGVQVLEADIEYISQFFIK